MLRSRSRTTLLADKYSVKTKEIIQVSTGKSVSDEYWPIIPVKSVETCNDETHPGPPYRSGGPLGIVKSMPTASSLAQVELWRYPTVPYWFQKYYVDFRPQYDTSCPISNAAALGDAQQYGATAWKRFKPGKTGANLGQFLVELKDLPSLFKFRAKSFRDAGGNYLNYQFGWKPFLNDLQSFFELTKNLDRRLNYLKRNNNRFKKRGGTLLEDGESTTVTDNKSVITPVLVSGFYPESLAPFRTTTTTSWGRKVWFEALMRFYIPNIGSAEWMLSETVRQFGLYPSPSLVYELTPWSWLIDYFCNLGDVLDNLSDSQAAPNLVALYAYVMNQLIITRSYTTSFKLNKVYGDNSTQFPMTLSFKQEWILKNRAEASPFGFAFQSDALSDYQLSILSALGISRFPKIR